MMIWIWLTAGMLAKAVNLSVFNFKKRDLYTIPLAVGAGLFAVMKIAEEYQPGDYLEPWVGMPLGFAFVIAFAFKDRLLPAITEGTLFGYSLIAGYLLLSSTYIDGVGNNIISLILVTLLFTLVTYLILSSRQIGATSQTLLMTLFVCASIYIGYELAKNTVSFSGPNWELVVIGYSYLALLANVFYVLYFIPITGKRQSFKARMQNIREHAKDFEEKYIAVNSTTVQIFLTLGLFIGMLWFEYLNYVSDALLISIVLTFMMLVHTPPENSKFSPGFSPKSVHMNL